jgi:molybdate transport system substrate-binding protein
MKLLCTNGIKAVALELISRAGLAVDAVYASTNMLLEKIEGGETGDVAVLSAEAIDGLIAKGVLRDGSRVDIARSVIGVAVRASAETPDIATADMLRAALRSAKAVAYSRTGISGLYMPVLFDKLGVAAEIAPKAVIPSSGTVGDAVARGDADIGLQQVSELLPVRGIKVIGPLPDAVQLVTVFSAGTFASTSEPQAARTLVETLSDSASRSLYEAKGLEPAF